MKRNRDKELVLEQLRKIPIITVACEKVGVGKSSVYRWREEDKKFSKDLEEALTEGESLVNDMGESQLISLKKAPKNASNIKERNLPAIRFWLNHRHAKFRDHVDITARFEKQEELTQEQEEVVREALRLASLGVE